MWTILRTAILAIILFLFSRLVPTQRVSRETHLGCKDWHEEKARQSELGQARLALHRPYPGKLIRGDCSEAATGAGTVRQLCSAERLGEEEQGSKIRAIRLVEGLGFRNCKRLLK